MTHYVGRSVEGDEGVVVADGMSVERLVCGGGDGGVGDHVVVVVKATEGEGYENCLINGNENCLRNYNDNYDKGTSL